MYGFDLELADAGSELTTSLYTFCEAVEADGHFHDDGLLVGDLVEVDVQDVVLDGMELSFLEDGHALVTVDVEVNGVDFGGVDELAEFSLADAESIGLGQTVLTLSSP